MATEKIAKANIKNITNKIDTTIVIGLFAGFQSIAAMIASSLAGFIWFWLGAEAAFLSTSVVTLLVIFYFVFIVSLPKVDNVK